MAVKERRTKILLSLFLIADVDFSYLDLNERIQKIFDLTLNQKTRGTISGLIKEGAIEKPSSVIANPTQSGEAISSQKEITSSSRRDVGTPRNDNSYRLTEKGFAELSLGFPFFRYLKGSWDGKFRIISYEIPEKKREIRDRLRREMQGWGLGPWHRSFWVTPHPVLNTLKDLVSQKEEEQYIQAFEADHKFGKKEILIEKVWNKSSLDKLYRDLFKKWHDILSGEMEKSDKLKKVISDYVDILRIDPGLPKELIGESWIGFEGWNIFKEIKSILLS